MPQGRRLESTLASAGRWAGLFNLPGPALHASGQAGVFLSLIASRAPPSVSRCGFQRRAPCDSAPPFRKAYKAARAGQAFAWRTGAMRRWTRWHAGAASCAVIAVRRLSIAVDAGERSQFKDLKGGARAPWSMRAFFGPLKPWTRPAWPFPGPRHESNRLLIRHLK